MYPFGCTNYPITNMYQADLTFILNEIKRLSDNQVNPGILAEKGSLITVGARNCNFKTITAAVDYAKTFCTKTDRALILIMPGTYNEEIVLNPNPGIDLFGLGDVVVQAPSTYPVSPLYAIGDTHVTGIHFKALTGTNSYALHIEAQNVPAAQATGEMVFTNCTFESAGNAGAGIGMGPGLTVYMDGCRFISTAQRAFYAHNYPGNVSGYQVLRCKDCDFFGSQQDVWLDDAVGCQNLPSSYVSTLYASFMNCAGSVNTVLYRKSNTETYAYVPSGERIAIEQRSVNTLPGLDYFKRTVNITGYYISGSNAAISVPVQQATQGYAWAFQQQPYVISEYPTRITGASISGTIAGGINISVPGKAEKVIAVFLEGHPTN